MRRRISTALLLSALSISSVAAVAPPADEPTAPGGASELDGAERLASLVEGATAQTSLGSDEARDLLRARFETHARDAALTGALDVLDELPGLTPLAADARSGEGAATTIEVGPLELTTPVGDLDGDGGADVAALSVDNREDGTTTYDLAALRGRDGAVLWELPEADGDGWWFPYGVPDLDGDGADDLGTVAFSWDDGCDCEGWDEEQGWAYTITQSWAFRSGRTGEIIARRTIVGEEWGTYETSVSSDLLEDRYTVRYESHSRDVVAPFWFVGDQDGDGRVDIASTTADLDYEYHYDERERLGLLREVDERYIDTGVSRMTVESIDGTILRDLGDVAAPGFGWIQPMGTDGSASDLLLEIDGDARLESACTYDPVRDWSCTESGEQGAELTLVVVEAGSYDVRWTRDTDTDPDLAELYGSVLAAGADLTGDGVTDLVRDGAVLDGRDGSRWEPLRDRYVEGYLGDDGRPLVLSTTWSTEDEFCAGDASHAAQDRVEVVRIDGRSGQILATSGHDDGETCETGPIILGAFAVGDHDGDGLRDVAIGRYAPATDTFATDIEPALGGEPHTRGITGGLYAIGDVDGDGDDDLNLYDPYGGQDELVVSMPGAVTLWELDGGVVSRLGDVDADGRADVLVFRWTETEREDGLTFTHWDEVARGIDGQLFWHSAPVTHEYLYAEYAEIEVAPLS